MKKATYSIVFTPGVREALEVAARRDRRSVSSFLEKIVIDYLEKEDIPWTNGTPASVPAKVGRPKKSVSKK